MISLLLSAIDNGSTKADLSSDVTAGFCQDSKNGRVTLKAVTVCPDGYTYEGSIRPFSDDFSTVTFKYNTSKDYLGDRALVEFRTPESSIELELHGEGVTDLNRTFFCNTDYQLPNIELDKQRFPIHFELDPSRLLRHLGK